MARRTRSGLRSRYEIAERLKHRGEIRYLAGGLIATGLAATLALPAMSHSALATAALVCFSMSIPCLTALVLALRLHRFMPQADDYDCQIDPAPFEPPAFFGALEVFGFVPGVLGVVFLFFDFWWVCGAAFTVLAIAGYWTWYQYACYLDRMVMAAAMQGPERKRIAEILRKNGSYCASDDPGISQLFRPVDPALQALLGKAYAHITFPFAACGTFFMQGEVHQAGRVIGTAYLSHATTDPKQLKALFVELVLFESQLAFQQFEQDELKLPRDFDAVVMKKGAATAAQYRDGVLVFVEPKRSSNGEKNSSNISVAGQSIIFCRRLPWWRGIIGNRRRSERFMQRLDRQMQQWRTLTYGKEVDEPAGSIPA